MSNWSEERWEATPVVVLDTETTGLRNSDTICEVSIAVFTAGEVQDIFTSYVNPMQPIPQEAEAVHGIRDRDVVDAPLMDDIAETVNEYLELGFPLVAHGMNFDARMLKACSLIRWPEGVPTLCTSDHARYRDPALKSFPNHQLTTVSTFFGMYKERKNMHRAEADVRTLGELLPRLMGRRTVSESMTKLSHEWGVKKAPKGRR